MDGTFPLLHKYIFARNDDMNSRMAKQRYRLCVREISEIIKSRNSAATRSDDEAVEDTSENENETNVHFEVIDSELPDHVMSNGDPGIRPETKELNLFEGSPVDTPSSDAEIEIEVSETGLESSGITLSNILQNTTAAENLDVQSTTAQSCIIKNSMAEGQNSVAESQNSVAERQNSMADNYLNNESSSSCSSSRRCSRTSANRDDDRIRRKSSSTINPAYLLSASSSDSEMNMEILTIRAKSSILEYNSDDEDDEIIEEEREAELSSPHSSPSRPTSIVRGAELGEELTGVITKAPKKPPRLSVSEEHGQSEAITFRTQLSTSSSGAPDSALAKRKREFDERYTRIYRNLPGESKNCMNVEDALGRLKSPNNLGDISLHDRRINLMRSLWNYSTNNLRQNQGETQNIPISRLNTCGPRDLTEIEENTELQDIDNKIMEKHKQISDLYEKIVQNDSENISQTTTFPISTKHSLNGENFSNKIFDFENELITDIRGTEAPTTVASPVNLGVEKRDKSKNGTFRSFFSRIRKSFIKSNKSRRTSKL